MIPNQETAPLTAATCTSCGAVAHRPPCLLRPDGPSPKGSTARFRPGQPNQGASLGRTQRSVIEILRREPGATIQTIADSLSITHASATYALNQLRAKGLVCQRRDGRTKLNFLVSDANDGNRTSLQPVLADPRKRMMLEMLAGEPHRQRTINWLANRIGASHAFVRRCLPNLVEQGFLALDRTPDRYYIRAQAKLIAFLAKKAPEPEPSARPPSGPPAEGDMVR